MTICDRYKTIKLFNDLPSFWCKVLNVHGCSDLFHTQFHPLISKGSVQLVLSHSNLIGGCAFSIHTHAGTSTTHAHTQTQTLIS